MFTLLDIIFHWLSNDIEGVFVLFKTQQIIDLRIDNS